MNKLNLVICVFAAVLLVTSVVSAVPESKPVTELTKDGKLVERVDFIHYANGVTKPARPTKEPTCYALIGGGSGIRWPATVNYVINPENNEGLSENDITTAIAASAGTWDAKTNAVLFNPPTIDNSAQYGVDDGKNAIVFGKESNANIIAVTTIWYYRGVGKRFVGQILEFDILFNEYYQWGNAEGHPELMDLQNIATHELGHGVGLDDIYTGSCSAVTMYGYSGNGDIEKRTLEQPDINGLQKLYGI